MSTNDDIHKDLYDKFHGLADTVGKLTGAVEASNAINVALIGVLKKVLVGAFLIIVILILALIFGALGERGFNAVTDKMPSIPMSADAIPAHNDFDKWNGRKA